MKISERKVRWFRMKRSGLVDPFADPMQAADALAGIQAQILPAAGLSLWNRTPSFTYAQLDTLLHEARDIVKLWGQRGTLHLYKSEDWPLFHGALSGLKSWTEKAYEKRGGSTDDFQQALEGIEELLKKHKIISRSELRETGLPLDEFLLSSWGGIFHVLTRRGVACHAGSQGNEACFAFREHWLPDLCWTPPEKEEANITLARRYFRVYGPSTPKDLAYWRGARLRDALEWLKSFDDLLQEVQVGSRRMLLFKDDLEELLEPPPPKAEWPIRMLYRFDPHLLAHKDKSWLVDPQFYDRIWRPAGHIEGCLLEHGRLVGSWRYDRVGTGLSVTVFPFKRLSTQARQAVHEISPQIANFFGRELVELDIKKTLSV